MTALSSPSAHLNSASSDHVTFCQSIRLGILALVLFVFSDLCRCQTISHNPTGVFVAGGSVRASALQSDGKLIVGGQFVAINGVPRTNIARLNADGTVDQTWDPGATGGIPYNTYVSAVAVHGDTIYLAGTFSFAGGEPRNGLAAIDAKTGLATPWDPDPGSTNFLLVKTIAVSEDGSRIFVSGSFTSIGGLSRTNIAAIAATDGAAISSWNPNPDSGVEALAISGDTLYVGGDFLNIGGEPRSYLAAVSASTGAVASWAPTADKAVATMVVAGNTLYVGGYFQKVGSQPHPHVAAVDMTTGNVATWNPGLTTDVVALAISGNTVFAGGGSRTSFVDPYTGFLVAIDAATGLVQSWSPKPDSLVSSLAVSGSTLYVGGMFSHIGGNLTGGFGSVDIVSGQSLAKQVSWQYGTVATLQTQPDGKVVVGGTFTSINDVPRNNLARLNVDGTVDTAWHPDPDGSVNTVSTSGSVVYVAGQFVNIGGHFRKRLAAVDIATGAATTWQPDPDNAVQTIGSTDDLVYVGGDFQYVGNAQHPYLAALDTATGLAINWNPDPDDAVNLLAIGKNTLYVSGGFHRILGQSRSLMASIDIPSRLVTAWNPAPNGNVFALLPTADAVYIGGDFSQVGQEFRDGIAALDPVTGELTEWTPALVNSGTVTALVPLGTNIVVAGRYPTSGGEQHQSLALVDTSTGDSSLLNLPITGGLSVPESQFITTLTTSNGRVLLGGDFETLGSVARGALAMITPDGIFTDGFGY